MSARLITGLLDGILETSTEGAALGDGTADGNNVGVFNGKEDGIPTGFDVGAGKEVILLAKPDGNAQAGETCCEHCLYGLLLHTAPGSQHTESSVQA